MTQNFQRARLAFRAQLTLTKVLVRKALADLTVLAIALVFALSAVAIMNIGFFMSLAARLGPLYAGLIVGAGNSLLALLLVRRALGGSGMSDEERLAREVCDMANAALEEEVVALRDEFRSFASDWRAIKRLISLPLAGLAHPLRTLMDLLLGRDSKSGDAESNEA